MNNALVRQGYVLLVFFICQANRLVAQAPLQSPVVAPDRTNSQQPGTLQGPAENGRDRPVRKIIGPNEMPQPFPEAKAISQPKNDQELSAAVKTLTDQLARSGRFSGSILLAVDGNTTVDAAGGDANKQVETANTPETAYDTGSIGKLLTQIAILQFVDAGKLTLDDPIAKYLRDYPDPEIARKVTIRHLLLHKTGIPDFLSHVTPNARLDAITEVKDFLPLFVHQPLDFEPGTAQRYSNSGYIVLGCVIEAVSGENYYDYVSRHILEPAGMSHSGFFDRTQLPSFVARSYEGTDDVTGMHPRRGSPAGGLQASVGDLFRLVQAVNSGKMIKPESVSVLRDLIPHPPNATPPAESDKLMGYGISGGGPGISAALAIDPSGRYTRIVLCNSSPPMAMSMAATLREWTEKMPKTAKD